LEQPQPQPSPARVATPRIPPPAVQGKQVGSAIPVSDECSMTIVADGVVTQEGLERLKQYIDLIKTWFPSQRETQPSP
jgi:hypothetical protein